MIKAPLYFTGSPHNSPSHTKRPVTPFRRVDQYIHALVPTYYAIFDAEKLSQQ